MAWGSDEEGNLVYGRGESVPVPITSFRILLYYKNTNCCHDLEGGLLKCFLKELLVPNRTCLPFG